MTDKITAPKGRIVFDIPSWTEPAGDGKYRVRLGQPVVVFKIPMAALADFAAQGTAAHEIAEAVVDLRDLFAEAQRDPEGFNRAVKAAVEETVEKTVAEEAPDSEVPGLHDMRRVALEKANKRIIELQEEAELNRRTLVAVSRDLASKTVECQTLLTRLENLEEEFVEAQQRTDEQAKELVNKGTRIDALIRENEAKDNRHREEIGDLRLRMDTQADTIRQQREEKARQHETIQTLQAALDKARNEIDDKHRELAERMRQVSILSRARFDIGATIRAALTYDEVGLESMSYLEIKAAVESILRSADLLRTPLPELAKLYPPSPDQLAVADRAGSVAAAADPMDDLI